jgi:hypothetical protein
VRSEGNLKTLKGTSIATLQLMRLKPLFLSLLMTCSAWAGAPRESANKRVEIKLVSTPNNPLEIVTKNPRLIQDFNFLKSSRPQSKVIMAVIGDFPHVEAFSEIIEMNKSEIANNNIDDDGNGYIDDVMGVNLNDHTGHLDRPVASGHENGIFSLLHAVSRNNLLQDDIRFIPINITAANNRFDAQYIKKLSDGIDYAVARGAKVISMSLGVSEKFESFFRFINNDGNKSRSYYEAAVKRAVDAGVLLFGAVSNDPNRNQDFEKEVPSNSSGVIGVANVNDDGVLQSAYGKSIAVAYYGTGLYVWNGYIEGFRTVKGSSFATPMVALAAAIAKSNNPDLSSKDILEFKKACEKNINGSKTVGSGCVFSPVELVRATYRIQNKKSELEVISY